MLLSRVDVEAALAYYFEHREQIDQDIRKDEEHLARFMAETASLSETPRQRKPPL